MSVTCPLFQLLINLFLFLKCILFSFVTVSGVIIYRFPTFKTLSLSSFSSLFAISLCVLFLSELRQSKDPGGREFQRQ